MVYHRRFGVGRVTGAGGDRAVFGPGDDWVRVEFEPPQGVKYIAVALGMLQVLDSGQDG